MGYWYNKAYGGVLDNQDTTGKDMTNIEWVDTPSGSNFGNTVTGVQDIYDDYQAGEPDLGRQDDYGTRVSTWNEPSSESGFGQTTYPEGTFKPYVDTDPSNDWWGDSGLTTYDKSVSKMGKGSRPTYGSDKSGSSGGSGSGITYGSGSNGSAGKNTTTGTTGSRYTGIPDMPTMDTFETSAFTAPERDTGRVDALTRQKSAAGLRAMRAQIQKAMGQGYRNPNVKRMTLRDALAGYGQGIENVMSGAQSQAENAYNKEYETSYDTAAKNWRAQNNTKLQNWNAQNTVKVQDWNNKVRDYLSQI